MIAFDRSPATAFVSFSFATFTIKRTFATFSAFWLCRASSGLPALLAGVSLLTAIRALLDATYVHGVAAVATTSMRFGPPHVSGSKVRL